MRRALLRGISALKRGVNRGGVATMEAVRRLVATSVSVVTGFVGPNVNCIRVCVRRGPSVRILMSVKSSTLLRGMIVFIYAIRACVSLMKLVTDYTCTHIMSVSLTGRGCVETMFVQRKKCATVHGGHRLLSVCMIMDGSCDNNLSLIHI